MEQYGQLGQNTYGQLGTGDTTTSTRFRKVKLNANGDYLTDIIAITGGPSAIHAIDKKGNVWSLGYNYYGQFGTGYGTSGNANPYPKKMRNVPAIMQIAAGENHTIMLAADGTVWGAGYNGYGQIGNGTTTDYSIPQRMYNEDNKKVLKGIKEVSSDFHSTYLVTEAGEAYSLGYNNYGQLAIGTTATKTLPCKMLTGENTPITGVNHIKGSGYLTFLTTNENDLYVVGFANRAQNFTESTASRYYLTKAFTDKKIIGMAVTVSQEYQTGLVIDAKGNIWTVRI